MKTKKKQTFKSPTPDKKKKTKWSEIFITAFAIVSLGGFLVWLVIFNYQQEKQEQAAIEEYRASLPPSGQELDHKLVCMASDKYHGDSQAPVIVSDRIYYGCSQKAIRDLSTNENSRFAIDPYSKAKVDKAKAFITMSPVKPGAILYFESGQNAKKYLKK